MSNNVVFQLLLEILKSTGYSKPEDDETTYYKDIHAELQKKLNEYCTANKLKPLNINSLDEDHRSALHDAAVEGNKAAVQILLAHPDIDINIRNDAGYTPLMSAVSANKLEIVKLLLDKNADFTICNENGRSVFHFAITKENPQIFDLLITKMESSKSPGEFKKLINATDKFGTTPLHSVCSLGSPSHKIIETLLIKGANINAKNKLGETPLHILVQEQHETLALLLVDKFKADYSIVDNEDKLALDYSTSDEFKTKFMKTHQNPFK